jgi:FkbM family methyltransferase
MGPVPRFARTAASLADGLVYGSGWAWYRPGAWTSRAGKAARAGAVRAFAATRPDVFPFRHLDVGARGGPGRTWALAAGWGLVDLVLVEPDPTEAASLRRRWPDATVVEAALGAEDGTRALHLTAQPGRSSVLEPDPDAVAALGRADDYAVVRTVDVDLRRLDGLPAAEVAAESIKVDVQGLELEVLEGFGARLDGVLAVELEVALQRTYRGQPDLGQVCAWLDARGFVPVELRPLGLSAEGVVDANVWFERREVAGARDEDVLRAWRLLNGITNAGISQRL